MSVQLAKMVSKAEKEVTQFVTNMEDRFGYPSADVRLLGEIAHQVKQKTARLGLDPNDTTLPELYHALLAKFDNDSDQIDKALGITPQSTFDQKVSRAVEIMDHTHNMNEVWGLKPSSSKNLLRELRPKKLMKHLNYRSLDSMLKHENLGELLLTLSYIESASWQKSFTKRAKLFSSTDYELRPPTIIKLASQRWQKIKGPSACLAIAKINASVGIWPAQQMLKARILHLLLMLMEGLKELGIGSEVKSIVQIHPTLGFWAGMEHLLSLEGERTVSLNIKDVATNHLNDSDYTEAVTQGGSQSLWTELMARYRQYAPSILPELEDEINKLSVPMPSQLAFEHASTGVAKI